MNVHFDFSERVVVVTGAAGNLGLATAQAFARSGAHLVLLEYNRGQLSVAFPDMAGSAAHLLMEGIDVNDAPAVRAAAQTAFERFGRIDVLVNTVGGYRAGKPVHQTDYETWDFMLNLNARSVFTMSREILPLMLAQGWGKIINIAAAPALKGAANSSAYGAAKSAVARLTESMAEEYKKSNINVNAVLPASIDTPQNRAAAPDADFSRWVTPDAIAQVILFLASDAAAPLNGVLLPVFGQR